MFKRFFGWIKKIFGKKEPEEEEITEEIPTVQEDSIEETERVYIEEFSPDVFEASEEDKLLVEEEKDLERQVLELKKTREVGQNIDAVLSQLSPGEDIFAVLGADDFVEKQNLQHSTSDSSMLIFCLT